MATYDFLCEACGPFEVSRPMADGGAPATCPECGGRARRVFSAPGLQVLEPGLRRGLELEERSAHEPAVARAPLPPGRPLPHAHRHAH